MSTITTRSKGKKEVRDVRAEALKLANSQHIEGQTKEQTRLIAKGIQRGMEQYLRQQSEKARELDKRVKKIKQLSGMINTEKSPIDSETKPSGSLISTHTLPWLLLGISWCMFFLYLWLSH